MPTTTTTQPNSRHQEALELRNRGWTFQRIADQLGYASTGAVQYAVRSARGETGNRAARRASSRSTRTATTPTRTRKFGIEIEFNGITQPEAKRAIAATGLPVEIEGYGHHTRSYWKVTTDCTSGLEVVSPILQGQDGYDQVRKVMDALQTAGARIHIGCGLHVHHDARDLSGEALANLVEMYARSQGALDRLVAPSRRGERTYLGPLTAREVETIAAGFRAPRFDANRRPARVTRYRNLNATMAFETHGTVEFRQHQGTLNADKAIAWIKLGQAMIRAAEAGASSSIPSTVFEMLHTLSSDHGLEAEAAAFLCTRAFDLADAPRRSS